MADQIHKYDAGTSFEIQLIQSDENPFNISAASVKTIYFRKPDLTVVAKTASFVSDGTDGKIEYITNNADLDQQGNWKMQAYIKLGSIEKWSDIVKFKVWPNIP